MYILSDTKLVKLNISKNDRLLHTFRHIDHNKRHSVICSEHKIIMDYVKHTADDNFHVVQIKKETLQTYCKMFDFDMLNVKNVYCDLNDNKEKYHYELIDFS